jgi:hypothetical protein
VPWCRRLLAPPCSPHRCSLLPPRKQWLTAGFGVLLWPWWVLTRSLSSLLSPVFHPLSSSPLSFHLRSIPQAVAHGTGCRWCVVRHRGLCVGSWGHSHRHGALVLRQCDVARVWGLLDAHWAGIPLLGSPGVPLHSPDSLTSCLNGEEGGWVAVHVHSMFRVFRRHLSLPVVYDLQINIIQLVN